VQAPLGLLRRSNLDTLLRASGVSRFSISSPPVFVSILVCGILAALEFLLLAFGTASLGIQGAAIAAFGGVLFAALVCVGATYNFFHQVGGTITQGRCYLLAATDMLIVFVFSLFGVLIPTPTGDVWEWAVVAGAAFAVSVNMLVLGATSDPRLDHTFAPSLVLAVILLTVFFALGILSPTQIILGFLFTLVFAAFAALWVRIVIAPFARNFHENGLVLLHALLDAWAGWSRRARDNTSLGTLQMEAFFARHGRARTVRFDALLLRQLDAKKILWFAPELHPGPYADLGGSDLPSKAASALSALADEVGTFHGSSTHDENPTGREQLAKIFARVPPALSATEALDTASRSMVVERAGTTVTAQRIGGTIVLAATRAPKSSDDIDLAVGREVRAAVERTGVSRAILLDGHNCVDEDLGRTEYGTPEARALEEACVAAAKESAKLRGGALRVGAASARQDLERRKEFAIGARGIMVTVVASGDHKTAYILIDGNNLKRGLRAEILRAVQRSVEHAEVFTTDNHAVNTTMGADNEVGSRTDNVPLIKEIARLTDEAVADLKPAEAVTASAEVEGVQVFGPGLALRISTTINAAVSVMVPSYLASMAAALFACAGLAIAFS